MRSARPTQRGFTLVELVLVILIMGIIALGSTQFIVNTVRGYHQLSQRDLLADNLRLAAQKLHNQLLTALAGSVRVNNRGSCLEWLPVTGRGFYQRQRSQPNLALPVLMLTQPVVGSKAVTARVASPDYYGVDAKLSAVVHEQTARDQLLSELRFATPLSLDAEWGPIAFVSSPVSYCLQDGALWRYRHYESQRLQPTVKQLPQREPQRVLMAQSLGADSSFAIDSTGTRVTLTLRAVSEDDSEQLAIEQVVLLTREEGL